MIRILRAFVWLRWRTLLNSLERRSSRDALERFSIAVEQLAPTIAAIVLLPSMIGLAGLASYAGWTLARGEPQGFVFEALRFLLLAACALAVAGPIMLPGGDRTNAVRLLLLPIPRGVLYLGHAVGALADPWVLLAAAVVIGLPLGLAAGGSARDRGAGRGGRPAADRDARGDRARRLERGAPHRARSPARRTARADRRRRAADARDAAGAHRRAPARTPPIRWASREKSAAPAPSNGRSSPRCRPSSTSARCGPRPTQDRRSSATALAALTGVGAALHLLAFAAFVRVLGSTATTGQKRVAGGAAKRWRIPGVSRATSAIAINQIRLALRTPRGRATLLSPIVVFGDVRRS